MFSDLDLSCKANAHDLLHVLRGRLKDYDLCKKVLNSIADADYGFGAEEIRSIITRTLETGSMPSDYSWQFRECCELVTNGANDGILTEEQHFVRLYAAMLWLHQWPLNSNFERELGRLGRFTESAVRLGPDVAAAALSFVVLLAQRTPDDYYPQSLFALSILLLLIAMDEASGRSEKKRNNRLEEVCSLLLVTVAREEQEMEGGPAKQWLLGLDIHAEGSSWYALCADLVESGVAKQSEVLLSICERVVATGKHSWRVNRTRRNSR